MIKNYDRREARRRRHSRIRKKLTGEPGRPRLAVFRSNEHIYAQVIDDVDGRTLVSASTLDPGIKPGIDGLTKTEEARRVGAALAQRARAAGLQQIVFDRGGYLYHGRVKALADAAREAGLEF